MNLCQRLRSFTLCKNMGETQTSNYEQKLLDSTKKTATDALKTVSKKAIQKTAETTGDLVGNKIVNKITKAASKTTREDPCKLPAKIDEKTNQCNQEERQKRSINIYSKNSV